MKKAARIAKFIACSAALAAGIALVWTGIWWAMQPRHNGKTIHWWFAQARTRIGTSKQSEGIETAFRAMGSEAVPFLMERLQAPDRRSDPNRDFLPRLHQKALTSSWVPVRIKKLLPAFSLGGASDEYIAFEIFKSMGLAAISAQPLLEQMLTRSDITLGYQPFYLLRSFGLKASNSIPVVAGLFASTNERIRSCALFAFAGITPRRSSQTTLLIQAIEQGHIRAAQGVPILFQLEVDFTRLLPKLGDELCMPGRAHSDALATCKRLRLHRKVLVPRFAEAMKDPDPRYRSELLQELRKDLSGDATPALDAVLKAMNDPFDYVRAEAAKTLAALKPRGDKLRAAIEILHSKKNEENKYVAEIVQGALNSLESE
jgi:HEAT repeat protein